MAFDVNEIAIKMHVAEGKPKQPGDGCGQSGSGNATEALNEAMVRECVRRVLLILSELKER